MEFEVWLDEQGVEDGWELAPTLVNLGYQVKELAAQSMNLRPADLALLLTWLSISQNAVFTLLAEIGQGAGRISEIVKALKSYSYLDQAPVQAVDLHEGLDNTLLILRSKLRNLSVRRQYARHLPKIEAYGSELNQVWTNLISNAADALDGRGEITLRTRQAGDWVVVEVEDNGPGIPPEIQSPSSTLFLRPNRRAKAQAWAWASPTPSSSTNTGATSRCSHSPARPAFRCGCR